MVVWGGAGASYLGTGGRYDPSADTWTSTSAANAPAARVGQAAAWSNDSLIVWGGYNGDYLASGGRYCGCASSPYYRDADGDGRGNAALAVLACAADQDHVNDASDCDDTNGAAWGVPSEVSDLRFSDRSTLVWSVPQSLGGLSVVYDLVRSEGPASFGAASTCVASDTANASTSDPSTPGSGHALFYLARAQSACASGEGSLGTSSSGVPRTARTCP
jgi:hypothetical protein